MTTLENLWYGNIIPFEQFLSGNSHFKELVSTMAKDRENLSDGLTPEQNEWLEKYDDVINEMHSIAEVEAFKYGVRLAAWLLKEAMQRIKIENLPETGNFRFGEVDLLK